MRKMASRARGTFAFSNVLSRTLQLIPTSIIQDARRYLSSEISFIAARTRGWQLSNMPSERGVKTREVSMTMLGAQGRRVEGLQ